MNMEIYQFTVSFKSDVKILKSIIFSLVGATCASLDGQNGERAAANQIFIPV